MTNSNTLRAGLLAMTVATLAACGGGGSGGGGSPGGAATAFDSTEFQGVWKFNDGRASGNPAGCTALGNNNFNYGSLYRPMVLTADTMTLTIEVYSDLSCTTYLGLLETTSSVAWSAGTLPGRTHVARALLTSTGFALKRDGAPGFALKALPQSGVTSKEILDVVGTLLYGTDLAAPKDADGYPTAVEATAQNTR